MGAFGKRGRQLDSSCVSKKFSSDNIFHRLNGYRGTFSSVKFESKLGASGLQLPRPWRDAAPFQ